VQHVISAPASLRTIYAISSVSLSTKELPSDI